MSIDVSKTLGALVEEHPGVSRMLERLGLDYCCGGARTLLAACHKSNLDVDEVVRILELAEATEPAPAIDWSQRSTTELVDFIEATHHHYTRVELSRLEPILDKVCRVHGDGHAELFEVRRLFNALKCDLMPHFAKEEQVLFPAIRAPGPGLAAPIQVMLMEHDAVGDLLRDLRQATQGYQAPDGACASYRSLYTGLLELEEDLHRHIHLENNVLFPRCVSNKETPHEK